MVWSIHNGMGNAGSVPAAEAIKDLRKKVNSRTNHSRGFFDRKEEVLWLLDYLAKPPEGVLAIVGPKSCGKTAVIQHLTSIWGTRTELTVSRPIIYIDCRLTNFGEMQDAVRAVKEALGGFLDKAENLFGSLQLSASAAGFGGSLSREAILALRGQLASATTVMEMIGMFRSYLARNPAAAPTLILDEAQYLKQWPKREFDNFKGILTALTKQNHQAHIIFCSSDDFFIDWLGTTFETSAWKAYGIGPFAQADARDFFQFTLSAPEETFTSLGDPDWEDLLDEAKVTVPSVIDDDRWRRVFELCGGSPLHLRAIALDIIAGGRIDDEVNFQSCLDNLYDQGMVTCCRGMNPPEGAGWSGPNHEKIMGLLKDRDYVGFEEVVSTAFADNIVAARREVHSMVTSNVLHIRYVSSKLTYVDMPNLANRCHRYQVMAMNPSHLHAMREAMRSPESTKFYM